MLLLCAAVRMAAVTAMPRDYGRLPRDPDAYGYLAGRIAAGLSYTMPGGNAPTAMRPPLYPLLLAPVYAAGLGDTVAPLLLYAVIDALACLALYGLGREMGGSRRAALAAALGWALYLPQVAMEARLWTEPLAALLATAALWALTAAVRRGGLGWCALGGALMGLGALTRSTALPLAGLCAAGLALGSAGPARARVGRAAAALLACALVVSPWVARNAVALGAFVPTTTHGGVTVYEGNCGLEDTDFLRNIHIEEAEERFARLLRERDGVAVESLSEVERDRLYRAEARRIILRHPFRYAALSLNRFVRLWFNMGYKGEPPSWRSACVCALHTALLAVLVAALVRGGWRRWRVFAPALAFVAGGTLLHMAVIAYVRYAFPLVPVVMAMAAAGMEDEAAERG